MQEWTNCLHMQLYFIWFLLSLVYNVMLEPQASQDKHFSLVNFCQIFDNLIGWTLLMLATQHWNRNKVYVSIMPTLVTLRWCHHYIVNHPWVHVVVFPLVK